MKNIWTKTHLTKLEAEKNKIEEVVVYHDLFT